MLYSENWDTHIEEERQQYAAKSYQKSLGRHTKVGWHSVTWAWFQRTVQCKISTPITCYEVKVKFRVIVILIFELIWFFLSISHLSHSSKYFQFFFFKPYYFSWYSLVVLKGEPPKSARRNSAPAASRQLLWKLDERTSQVRNSKPLRHIFPGEWRFNGEEIRDEIAAKLCTPTWSLWRIARESKYNLLQQTATLQTYDEYHVCWIHSIKK